MNKQSKSSSEAFIPVVVVGLLIVSILLQVNRIRNNRSIAIEQAETAWSIVESDISINPVAIFIMRYDDKDYLSDETTESSIYDDIPDMGYMVCFFGSDDHIVVLNDEGRMTYKCRLKDLEDDADSYVELFSPESLAYGVKAIDTYQAESYLLSILSHAHNTSEEYQKGDLELDRWYRFSYEQEQQILHEE